MTWRSPLRSAFIYLLSVLLRTFPVRCCRERQTESPGALCQSLVLSGGPMLWGPHVRKKLTTHRKGDGNLQKSYGEKFSEDTPIHEKIQGANSKKNRRHIGHLNLKSPAKQFPRNTDFTKTKYGQRTDDTPLFINGPPFMVKSKHPCFFGCRLSSIG